MQAPSSAAFQACLRNVAGFERATVTAITQFPGGASNLTCKVELTSAPVAAVVLRLQRERGIFEPYDVVHEANVVRALHGSGIPVPDVLAIEPGTVPLGAPFAVFSYIDAPHMGEAGPEGDYGAFVRAVCAIHALDWRRFVARVLDVPVDHRDALKREILAVAARMPAFGCEGDALLSRARDTLLERTPTVGSLALCQGDINVYNYLFRAGAVVGVVDWEQARISDPRSDIGQLVSLGNLKGAPFGPAMSANFVRAYEAASGHDLEGMEFFRARWLFELGVIHEGWVAFNGTSPWYNRADLDRLLTLSLAELG